MKVFRELELRGTNLLLAQALEAIEAKLDGGWTRESDRERSVLSLAAAVMYCFSCTGTDEREAAEVWLAYRDDDTLYVANIIPQEAKQLSFDQYNSILEEFYERFAEPVAETLGLKLVLTAAVKEIEDWVSEETGAKLRRFSRLANKATGSAHPRDQQRWLDFLVSIHTEASALDPGTLVRWLVETESWPEDVAYDLGVEYEFARSLLTFYNEHKS